jgi:ABC-2 type transport system permease protein
MMTAFTSWRALFVREYLEHRMAFLWAPLGIVALLALAAFSAIGLNRVRFFEDIPFIGASKIYEMGYLVLLALWLAYLGVALFFYFGDAFAADRRNNAMLFWKSMPVTDAKILASKTFAGLLIFPAIILVVCMVTGLLYYLMVNIGAYLLPGLGFLSPIDGILAFVQITLFGVACFLLSMMWYAPFFAWVGGLSTVFGRWSLPLAFVIPGLLIVIENVSFFGQGPRGGYIWNYIAFRWNNDALNEADFELMLMNSQPFSAGFYFNRLMQGTDWTQVGIGLAFAAVVIWLASEYRRRRIA